VTNWDGISDYSKWQCEKSVNIPSVCLSESESEKKAHRSSSRASKGLLRTSGRNVGDGGVELLEVGKTSEVHGRVGSLWIRKPILEMIEQLGI
jgi:hypothetical protein